MRLVTHALVWAVMLVSSVQLVLVRHEARSLFVELQSLQARRDKLNEEWGRLLLEQATMTDQGRIEALAETELEMRRPLVISPSALVAGGRRER